MQKKNVEGLSGEQLLNYIYAPMSLVTLGAFYAALMLVPD